MQEMRRFRYGISLECMGESGASCRVVDDDDDDDDDGRITIVS